MNSPPSTQQNQQELESRNVRTEVETEEQPPERKLSVSDQRTEAETGEQPPERKLSIITMIEKGEDENFGIVGAGVKTLRFPLVNWKVQEFVYNEELQGYLTIHGFTRRIKKFNATSRRLRIYQMMMVFSWVLVSLVLIVSISMIKSIDENASLERIICGIFLSKIIFGLLAYYLFVLRKGKQQVNYLNNLLEGYNKKDLQKNVNWKLITPDKNVDNRCNKTFLAIELGPPPTYQECPSPREPPRVVSVQNCKTNNIVDIRESLRSVSSIDSVDTYQIRTAVKTRYFYEAIPSIPPPAYYVSVGRNRYTNNAIPNEKVEADDNTTNETLTNNNSGTDNASMHSSRSYYYETSSSL